MKRPAPCRPLYKPRILMSIALYTLASSLHKGLPDVASEQFITEIESCLGSSFEIFGDDFSTYGTCQTNVIYVRTGGTEGLFRSLSLPGDIRLLTSGRSNSLAAAMEILSYVRSRGGRGEILHGEASAIAGRLRSGFQVRDAEGWIRPLPHIDLGGARLGVIGRPSDWLIASGVEYAVAASRLGVTLVDIDIAELVSAVSSSSCDLGSFAGSEAVHSALCELVGKYRLDGLTLRCFDLLDSIHNTGCLALARLCASGIPSACEGDIPALLSMMVAKRLSGCPGFQCNLSRISGDELLFAHCTVPLSMVKSYTYDTHFESGIGTAIKGELPAGPVTVFKISPDLGSMVSIPARLVRNQSEPGLCRTQVVLEAPGAADYFLSSPLANHHIIVPGTLF